MTNWRKQTALFVTLTWAIIGIQFPNTATQKNKITSDNTTETEQKVHGLLAQKISSCQGINSDYQEVYGFETEDYYVNICQLENSFFYYRKSKFNEGNDLLIPAEAVFGGNVFQATNGRTTYFVGKEGDHYYSSVMQNDNEIVFEPELRSPPSTLARDTRKPKVGMPVSSLTLNNVRNVSSESHISQDRKEDTRSQSSVCTQDKSAFPPHLSVWQKLIGKLPDTANRYAINYGHNFNNFIYDDNTANQALIETPAGTIINLNVALISETIDRVCVQALAEKQ